MNGHEFIDIQNSANAVSKQALEELKSVVAKYPYFSMARLVYLKQLRMNSDANFGHELPHAAVYAKSSEWLYEYIYRKEAVVADEMPEAVAAEPEPVPEKTAEAASNAPEIQQPRQHPAKVHVEEKQPEPKAADEAFELLGNELPAAKNELEEVLDQKLYTLSEPEKHSGNPTDLIEQFLTINPRIVPKADLPQENEDISLSSLQDDGEIVTEMLAKIYVSQGLISKAIDAYNKLSLKYPEKKAYFVAEIEKLEK